MRRIGLALVLLIGFLSTARATPCTQPDLEVGINGGQLTYNPELTFEDGSSVRVVQPVTPANVRLAIAADHEDNNEWIAIDGTFDPNAKYIGVELGSYTLLTTPDRRYACSRGIRLYDQPYDARIFTIDRYGHRSEAVSKPVVVIGSQPERHYRCGLYSMAQAMGSLMIAGCLFVILFFGGLLGKRSPSGLCSPVSPIIAENVARAIARRYGIKLAIAVLTTTGLWTFDHPYLAFQLGPFVVVWFIDVVIAKLVVRQFERVKYLARRDNWILINSSKLYAPGRVWAKASSLPTAGLA